MDERIQKTDLVVEPNLPAEGGFTWQDAAKDLAGLPDGGRNIAWEAVGRHMGTPVEHKVALRFLRLSGEREELTYEALARATNRFANALETLGVGAGDRVYLLLGRVPELYVAALGALRNGSVFCPLFSAFGPEPIKTRMERGDATVLVTNKKLYQRKASKIRAEVPTLKHVILTDAEPGEVEGCLSYRALMEGASESPRVAQTDGEDMAILHFTSGTTGKPKGAVHVHNAVLWHYYTGRVALDLHDDDVYWCTADPGWVTGTSYGIVAPLTCGVTSIIDEGELDADRWYKVLEEERVTVWYTAPTAIRMLMRAGTEVAKKYDLSSLRYLMSVGEPLNPEAVRWGVEAFGRPFHDSWWQTETGGIMITNRPALDVKPGSMGKPLPGIEPVVVEGGQLALRGKWPSQFRRYLHDEERTKKTFDGDLYLTGDLAEVDDEGYWWFVGRADDVIKSAGHLIGPFEVESGLMEHEKVVEVGVIGKPDEVAGSIVKAFVVLRPGVVADEALMQDLRAFARKRLGAAVAPREIEIVDDLPKTRSGKVMRRLLKARELGLPEGDTSTLLTKGNDE